MEIEFTINELGEGKYYIERDGRQVAELEFEVKGNILNAVHTGVRPELEGQGIAGRLFDEMVAYARENNYMVVPTCPYVEAKFKRNRTELEDIWKKG